MTPRWLLSLAILTPLVSGCFDSDGSSKGTEAGYASQTADETQASLPADSASTPASRSPKVDTYDGHLLASATATSAPALLEDEAASLTFHETITGYVLELAWTPSTPLSEQLTLEVRPANDDPVDTNAAIAAATGKGTLYLAVAASEFPTAGDYAIVVKAAGDPAGAAANQDYTLTVATFEDMEFDPTYSGMNPA